MPRSETAGGKQTFTGISLPGVPASRHAKKGAGVRRRRKAEFARSAAASAGVLLF